VAGYHPPDGETILGASHTTEAALLRYNAEGGACASAVTQLPAATFSNTAPAVCDSQNVWPHGRIRGGGGARTGGGSTLRTSCGPVH